jgi:hypothetical protein
MREKANCLNSNARFMRWALCFGGNTELPFGAGQRRTLEPKAAVRLRSSAPASPLASCSQSCSRAPASQPKRTLPARPRPRSDGLRKGGQRRRTACLARLAVVGTWGSMRQAEINAVACGSNGASRAPPSMPLAKKSPHI